MANAKENTGADEKYPGYDEDHQCHVYDFFFQDEKCQAKFLRIRSRTFTICRMRHFQILRHMPDVDHAFFDTRPHIRDTGQKDRAVLS